MSSPLSLPISGSNHDLESLVSSSVVLSSTEDGSSCTSAIADEQQLIGTLT